MVQQRPERREYREVIRDPDFAPPPILVLTGEESFFKRDLVNRVVSILAPGSRSPDTFTEIEPSGASELQNALIDLRTPSFFSGKRVIYCRNAESLLEQADAELTQAFLEGLPFGCLILDCRRLPRKSPFVAEAQKQGAVINCRRLWDTPPPWRRGGDPAQTELNEWVVAHAERLGLNLTLSQAGELVALTGNNPGAIDAELHKLLGRRGPGSTVRSEDIQALVPDRRQDSIFRVVDQTLLGRTAEASSALSRLFRFGHTYGAQRVTDSSAIAALLIGAFTSRLKALRRAHGLFPQAVDPGSLVSSGLVPKAGAQLAAQQLNRLSEADLERACTLLVKADRALKGLSGKFDPKVILHTTVLRLASLGRSA